MLAQTQSSPSLTWKERMKLGRILKPGSAHSLGHLNPACLNPVFSPQHVATEPRTLVPSRMAATAHPFPLNLLYDSHQPPSPLISLRITLACGEAPLFDCFSVMTNDDSQ
ncbi:hypothetical protein HN51_057968 [Arachis hypogaea]